MEFHSSGPEAEGHLLLIPRKCIQDAAFLTEIDHFSLIHTMIAQAENIRRAYRRAGYNASDDPYFHEPGHTSVSHLHMHILIGSSKSFRKRHIELPALSHSMTLESTLSRGSRR